MNDEKKCPDCGAQLTRHYGDTGDSWGSVAHHHQGGLECVKAQIAQEREKNGRQQLALGACLGALDAWRKAMPPGVIRDGDWKRVIKADARARDAAPPKVWRCSCCGQRWPRHDFGCYLRFVGPHEELEEEEASK